VIRGNECPHRRRKKRVVAVDRYNRIAEKDAARRNRRVGLVVVETELRVRAHHRMDVQVCEGVEVGLLRWTAEKVVWAEVELVRIPKGRPQVGPLGAGSIRDRKIRTSSTRHGVKRAEASRERGRGSGARQVISVSQRTCAEVAVFLRDLVLFLPREE